MVPPEYGGRAAVGKYGEPGVSTPPYTALSPETSWSLTASVIAGQPRMRLGKPQRENRVSYPARTEQALTTDLPSKPAAVRLYSDAGQCNVLALDFDAKDRTTEQIADVAYDVFQTEAMLDQAGAWFLTDHAHGGSHVYVLLEQPLAFLEARELVEEGQRLLEKDVDVGATVSVVRNAAPAWSSIWRARRRRSAR